MLMIDGRERGLVHVTAPYADRPVPTQPRSHQGAAHAIKQASGGKGPGAL